MRVAGYRAPALPRLELPGEGDALLAAEPLAPPRQQPQVALELAQQPLFGELVAHRHRIGERDQAARVDPRDGRVAVDERRQHAEGIALLRDLELDPRPRVGGARQLARADLDRDALLERGQHLGDQLDDLPRAEIAAGPQLLQLARAQLALADRPQGVAAQHAAVGEDLGDALVLHHREPKPGPLILEPADDADRVARDLQRGAVEEEVGQIGQSADELRHQLARQPAAPVEPEQQIDRHVGRAGDERRSLETSRGDGRQGARERLAPAALERKRALEEQAALGPGEEVVDAGDAGRGLGELLAALARAPQRDGRGRDVHAHLLVRRAVAAPVLVLFLEIQGHRAADRGAGGRDPEDGDLAVGAVADDRAGAHQLHRARPGRARTRFADGFEEGLHFTAWGSGALFARPRLSKAASRGRHDGAGKRHQRPLRVNRRMHAAHPRKARAASSARASRAVRHAPVSLENRDRHRRRHRDALRAHVGPAGGRGPALLYDEAAGRRRSGSRTPCSLAPAAVSRPPPSPWCRHAPARRPGARALGPGPRRPGRRGRGAALAADPALAIAALRLR